MIGNERVIVHVQSLRCEVSPVDSADEVEDIANNAGSWVRSSSPALDDRR
jgi:hypothetical protein